MSLVVNEDMLKAESLFVERILVSPAGYGLEVGGAALCVTRNENGRYEVVWLDEDSGTERLRVIPDAEDAAKFFVRKRHELGVGYDYEHGLLVREGGPEMTRLGPMLNQACKNCLTAIAAEGMCKTCARAFASGVASVQNGTSSVPVEASSKPTMG